MSGLTCTVDEIIKVTDWSSEGAFQKLYYKPRHSVKFRTVVLATSASKSHVDMETEPSKVKFSNGSGHAMATCYIAYIYIII